MKYIPAATEQILPYGYRSGAFAFPDPNFLPVRVCLSWTDCIVEDHRFDRVSGVREPVATPLLRSIERFVRGCDEIDWRLRSGVNARQAEARRYTALGPPGGLYGLTDPIHGFHGLSGIGVRHNNDKLFTAVSRY